MDPNMNTKAIKSYTFLLAVSLGAFVMVRAQSNQHREAVISQLSSAENFKYKNIVSGTA